MRRHILILFTVGALFFMVSCKSGTSEEDQKEVPLPGYEKEPYFKYLWHIKSENCALDEHGYYIDPKADVNVTTTWSTTKGKGAIVAVIDIGCDMAHEDLKANILNRTSNIPIEKHGTAVAGCIAAPINGTGIVGVAPEAELYIIALKDNSDASTIKAFEEAKAIGAKVINCSWGTYDVSEAVKAEIESIYDANITVVFAAGNGHRDLDKTAYNDESELPWVIGVSASSEKNDVAGYSDYGSNLDLLAPGGDRKFSSGILALNKMGGDDNSEIVNKNYFFTDGTSFAAPIVAATAALMYAVNPSLTPDMIRDILIATATKIGDEASYDTNGFDRYRAYGKVNVSAAIEHAKKLK